MAKKGQKIAGNVLLAAQATKPIVEGAPFVR